MRVLIIYGHKFLVMPSLCTTADEEDERDKKPENPFEEERSFISLNDSLPITMIKRTKHETKSTTSSHAERSLAFERERAPWVYG